MYLRNTVVPAGTDICSSAIAPALLYYRPSMALCNICIDLQGWRKCRKIAGSNRGPHIPVGYAGTQAQGGETIGWDVALIKHL